MYDTYGYLIATLDMFAPEIRIKAKLPRKQKSDLYVPSDNDVKKVLALVEGTDLEIAILFAAFGPLRRGEICGLKWSDFDMVERKLNINRSISPEGVVGNTKTHYSVRSIKLPHSVYQILADRKETSRSDWIFPHPKDPTKPITGSIALRRLRKILSQADLPRIRFHDLRHTFATWASKLTNINKVEISHTFMEDVSWLKNLRKLRWLELHLSPIKDLSVLSDHKYIHILSLCDLEITDISFIEQYQRLKFLDVVGCPIKDYTPILRIPPLEQLIIDEDVVESLGMDALVKHHPDAEIEVRRKKNNNDLW